MTGCEADMTRPPFPKKLEKVEVVGLGQACVDHLGRIKTYPQEDGKVELGDLHVRCGGPASTALVTLSRLGIKTSFLGSISDDPFGVEIEKNLERERVDASLLKVTPGYTSQFAFIAITKESGKRTVFWHRGTVPHLGPEDVDIRVFSNARVLHLDGLMIEASLEAARQAKSMGMAVVMDAGTMREGSRNLISMVDVLIASETFALPLVGSGASHEMMLLGLRDLCHGDIVITLGPRGSIGLSQGRTFRQEAFAVNAVDTTGAGDVYHGGYIYGVLSGWDMTKCMRFASAAAALKCREIGAQRAVPDLKTIQEFLGNQSYDV